MPKPPDKPKKPRDYARPTRANGILISGNIGVAAQYTLPTIFMAFSLVEPTIETG